MPGFTGNIDGFEINLKVEFEDHLAEFFAKGVNPEYSPLMQVSAAVNAYGEILAQRMHKPFKSPAVQAELERALQGVDLYKHTRS